MKTVLPVPVWLAVWVMAAGLAACADPEADYRRALEQLKDRERQVDAGYDQARAHNELIFGKSAWDDDAALIASLTGARDATQRAVFHQQRRIALEEGILNLPLMENAPETRVLYHLDLEAQRAKLAIFEISLEMYEGLLAEARGGNRDGFDALTSVYLRGVRAANERYRELDLARQERQLAMDRKASPGI